MLPKNATYLDINLNSSVITQRISAKLLTSTIECLIYMKNQIPFPFETFQQMTDKLKKCRSDDKQSWNNFLLDKQRLLAVETFDKVNSLLKNIIGQFETCDDIDEAVILFGATCLTPKEAFIIKLPTVTQNHFSDNHMGGLAKVARDISMSIMTNETLFDMNLTSKLSATNVYVLLKSTKSSAADFDASEHFHCKDSFYLPNNCKTIILNLVNATEPSKLNKENCCIDLVVFSEFDNIVISSRRDSFDGNCDVAEPPSVLCEKDVWYESSIFLKGYKDVLVKGNSIWTVES